MNDPRLDAETAERMLRGEAVGPPRLAELLAAASSEATDRERSGEEAAVTAFREARSTRSPQPAPRRHVSLVSLKAALIGLLLLAAGGITVATASQHLPGPFGGHRSQHTRTPATSRTVVPRGTPLPSPTAAGGSPGPIPHATPTGPGTAGGGPRSASPAPPKKTKNTAPAAHPHPTKKPRPTPKPSKSRTHKPSGQANRSVPPGPTAAATQP